MLLRCTTGILTSCHQEEKLPKTFLRWGSAKKGQPWLEYWMIEMNMLFQGSQNECSWCSNFKVSAIFKSFMAVVSAFKHFRSVCVINPIILFRLRLKRKTVRLQMLAMHVGTFAQCTQHFPTVSHSHAHTEDRERDQERTTQESPHPSSSSSLPCLSLFIYCLQFFHRTHIDAEKAGCECVSESFPDEGDKVEVISSALMQYDSP